MITAVAIIHEGLTYSAPPPNRHFSIIHQIYLATGKTVEGETQGFLDDAGNFLTRAEALKHAIACGQVFKRRPHDDWLYSENLW